MISSRSLFLCDQGYYLWKRRIIYALYLVLLEKVSQVASPESIFGGPVCYCQFGLANDSSSLLIDEGINPRDRVSAVFLGLGHVCDYFAWDCGTDYLVLRGWPANDHHGSRYA